MLTIREYRKIVHDWLVLLTGLSGSNVRPQKEKFGFNLVDSFGKPIAFDGMVCMFYFNFEDTAQDMYFEETDTSAMLKTGALSVTFIGESAEQYANQLQATAMGVASRNYLKSFGFAIQGRPNEIDTTREMAEKWFERRTLKMQFNIALDFVPPNTPLENLVQNVSFLSEGVEESVVRQTAQVVTVYPSTVDQTIVAEQGNYLAEVIVKAINIKVEPLVVSPSQEQQTFNATAEFVGFNPVVVNSAPLENIVVESTYEEQTITPSQEYYGFGSVVVTPRNADQEYLDFIQAYDLANYLDAPISYIGQSNISGETQGLVLNQVEKSYDPTEYTSELLEEVRSIYMNILGV